MSPHTDFVRTTAAHTSGLSSGLASGGPDRPAWDPARGVFTPTQRRQPGIDRTALCVQITLCIVVAALLFSVIALPKFRSAAARAEQKAASQTAVGAR